MLGHAVVQTLAEAADFEVYGAGRSPVRLEGVAAERLIHGVDALDDDALQGLFDTVRPEAVVNAVGVIKQLKTAEDPLQAIPLNALLPHRLAALCERSGARLVQISTDCVFAGDRGGYSEDDRPDAVDLYGLSKQMGEVTARPSAITLRTSLIGRELGTRNGLIEWFLHAGPEVKGYRRAVFSGLPTVVFAEVLRDHVLPRPDLHGVFHVGGDAIDKDELLRLAAEVYGVAKDIVPVDEPRIDRSLDSGRFRAETGFSPPPWRAMLETMRGRQG